MTIPQVVIPVTDPSQVGEVRRRTNQLGIQLGLQESECANAAIVATELATNLARHATAGEIFLGAVSNNSHRGIDILSIDRGPGITDIGKSMVDGFSTGGGPGNGLGAVCRLATEWDLFSSHDPQCGPVGSVIFARVTEKMARAAPCPFAWGAVSLPAPYELVCGDTWRVADHEGELVMMVADGLGHGPAAAAAADEAADVFDRDPFAPLPIFLQNAGARLQGTRGAAVAIARVEAHSRILRFVGIGNIAGHLRANGEEKGRGLMSHNGVVGGPVRKIHEFEYACPDQGILIMHSDGLQGRWDLNAYAGLQARHPSVIAGVLYRDFTRGRDDVTVAVARFSLA
jgi:anti-sigma regulatory factor (Ser/Thr protein kinase)